MSSSVKKIRRALLNADVNKQVVDGILEGIERRAVGEKVIEGVDPGQMFVKIVYDELREMMGSKSETDGEEDKDDVVASKMAGGDAASVPYRASGDPVVVLLCGLQGAGKTTAAGKLARYFKEVETIAGEGGGSVEDGTLLEEVGNRVKTNRKTLLAACDVYRPAAVKQLQILGDSVGVDVFTMPDSKNPVDIARQARKKAIEGGYDTLILDTAGRQSVDTNLMEELKNIKRAAQPEEMLLVVDSLMGQEAAMLTQTFDEAVGLTGAILTKTDGDSRGGAALSVNGVSGRPIKFVGTGEKIKDLEPFYPDRVAGKILGMGDVVGFVEQAASMVSKKEAERVAEKMRDATFDFADFQKQSKMVAQMGSFGKVAQMIPGMAGKVNDEMLGGIEKRMKKSDAIINSMTKKERANPALLISDQTAKSRLKRISKGSGTTLADAENFMAEFQKMRTMMSRMQKKMNGGGDEDMEGAEEEAMDMMGNRAMRRASKKKKKSGGGGRGFG